MKMQIQRLSLDAPDPIYGSKGAAGLDFGYPERASKTLVPGTDYSINLGWAVAVPAGYCLLLAPRSGVGTKYGLRIINTVGVIDSDYRGPLLANVRVEKTLSLEHGQRFIQGLLVPVAQAELSIVTALDETERGSNGFGSTDRPAVSERPSGFGDLAPDSYAHLSEPQRRPRPTHTHTTVGMHVSGPAFDEIASSLKAADYGHVFMEDGSIDMTGIALVRQP